MAQREVAYTFLDVKYPPLICKGCESEFEYIESDCTHPNVSLQLPNIGKSSKGSAKGSSKGANGENGVKGKAKVPMPIIIKAKARLREKGEVVILTSWHCCSDTAQGFSLSSKQH